MPDLSSWKKHNICRTKLFGRLRTKMWWSPIQVSLVEYFNHWPTFRLDFQWSSWSYPKKAIQCIAVYHIWLDHFLLFFACNSPTPDTNELTYLWPWSSFPMILTWLHITLPMTLRYLFIFVLTKLVINLSYSPSCRCLLTHDISLLGSSSTCCCTWWPLPYTPPSYNNG